MTHSTVKQHNFLDTYKLSNTTCARHTTSAKNIWIQVKWLRQSGCALSKPSETLRWRNTPHPASIPLIALHLALRLQFHHLFSLSQVPIFSEHSGIMAICDNTLEWVHWVRTAIGNALRCVTLRKSLLTFLLPVRKVQFSLYFVYPSFQVTRSMWLLTIHRTLRSSPVWLQVAISVITCAQPKMFSTLNTCTAMAAGAFLTCTYFEMGSKVPKFWGIVVSARANQ